MTHPAIRDRLRGAGPLQIVAILGHRDYMGRAKAIEAKPVALVDAFRRGSAQPCLPLDRRS
jgi:hypothetical protein